ncbi:MULTISPECIES: hypothetical protein [Hymenobacter]|uniref:CBM-cenC domain-containing protein n=1 Tax=Hymenobacter mucosus TaxID=1411120 RepID=A0A238YTQ3_9BACT|nr:MULTISPECIES: hypothetical protein [Hymenobacter]SNR74322.1 hypothetical protein SAMN06269173_10677 [Hymenobacter mucosus]
MVKYASAALLCTLFLGSCSQQPSTPSAPGVLASSSFENLDGWLPDAPGLALLSRDQAHSGTYSTMVAPDHDFSLGYNNKLSRLAPDWPAKLTIGAWVFLPNEQAAAKLVTEVRSDKPNQPNLLWEGLDLLSTVKVYNKWQYVEQTVTMPAAAKANSRLLVYLWRADSKQPVYLDDVQISLASK